MLEGGTYSKISQYNSKVTQPLDTELDRLSTVTAPLTGAATIQESSFWGPDCHIKKTLKIAL